VVRSAPRLRRAVDPDGAECAAVVLFDDLAPCCAAIDTRILPELARIAPAHDQKRRQRPQNGPASAYLCQPHPRTAEVAPSLSVGLSCGF
jgi:hypothetical protein